MRKGKPAASHGKGEKILKTRPSWRKAGQVKKIKIVMTVVMVTIIVSVAAACVLAWVTVDPIGQLQSAAGQGESSSFPPPSSESEEDETARTIGRFDLMLVDTDTAVPAGFELNPVDVDGVTVSKRIEEDLKSLLNAADQEGFGLTITSGYVSAEEQERLYQEKVAELMESDGLSRVRAEDAALSLVPRGNHSELQTGYAVRFASKIQGDGAFQDTREYKWLIANSLDYGFVLRYPENKIKATGKEFDPELFRYVGVENAKKMRQLGMCLEEYSQYMAKQQKNNT